MDKAALDVWYVQHASLRLDIAIVLRTIPIGHLWRTGQQQGCSQRLE